MKEQQPYGLKEIVVGTTHPGFETYQSVPVTPPEPIEWEYYMNRKGKIFLRNNMGGKATFILNSETDLNRFKSQGYGKRLNLRFTPK